MISTNFHHLFELFQPAFKPSTISSPLDPYIGRLTTDKERKRKEHVIKRTFVLLPKESDYPSLSFSAQDVMEFVWHCRSDIGLESCFIAGGGACHILENLPYSDVDITLYVTNGNFKVIKKVLLNFLSTQLIQKNEKYRSCCLETIEAVYIHGKKVVNDAHNLWNFIALGKIQVKCVVRSARQHLSTSDGFLVAFSPKDDSVLCLHVNRFCNGEEFEEARRHLRHRIYVIDEVETASRLFFRLVHKVGQGFEIDEKALKKGGSELKESDWDHCQQLIYKHLESHDLLDDKFSLLGNFINSVDLIEKSVTEGKIDCLQHFATAYLPLVQLQEHHLIERMVKMVCDFPRFSKDMVSLIRGMVLLQWLFSEKSFQCYQFPFSQESVSFFAAKRSFHFSLRDLFFPSMLQFIKARSSLVKNEVISQDDVTQIAQFFEIPLLDEGFTQDFFMRSLLDHCCDETFIAERFRGVPVGMRGKVFCKECMGLFPDQKEMMTKWMIRREVIEVKRSKQEDEEGNKARLANLLIETLDDPSSLPQLTEFLTTHCKQGIIPFLFSVYFPKPLFSQSILLFCRRSCDQPTPLLLKCSQSLFLSMVQEGFFSAKEHENFVKRVLTHFFHAFCSMRNDDESIKDVKRLIENSIYLIEEQETKENEELFLAVVDGLSLIVSCTNEQQLMFVVSHFKELMKRKPDSGDQLFPLFLLCIRQVPKVLQPSEEMVETLEKGFDFLAKNGEIRDSYVDTLDEISQSLALRRMVVHSIEVILENVEDERVLNKLELPLVGILANKPLNFSETLIKILILLKQKKLLEKMQRVREGYLHLYDLLFDSKKPIPERQEAAGLGVKLLLTLASCEETEAISGRLVDLIIFFLRRREELFRHFSEDECDDTSLPKEFLDCVNFSKVSRSRQDLLKRWIGFFAKTRLDVAVSLYQDLQKELSRKDSYEMGALLLQKMLESFSKSSFLQTCQFWKTFLSRREYSEDVEVIHPPLLQLYVSWLTFEGSTKHQKGLVKGFLQFYEGMEKEFHENLLQNIQRLFSERSMHVEELCFCMNLLTTSLQKYELSDELFVLCFDWMHTSMEDVDAIMPSLRNKKEVLERFYVTAWEKGLLQKSAFSSFLKGVKILDRLNNSGFLEVACLWSESRDAKEFRLVLQYCFKERKKTFCLAGQRCLLKALEEETLNVENWGDVDERICLHYFKSIETLFSPLIREAPFESVCPREVQPLIHILSLLRSKGMLKKWEKSRLKLAINMLLKIPQSSLFCEVWDNLNELIHDDRDYINSLFTFGEKVIALNTGMRGLKWTEEIVSVAPHPIAYTIVLHAYIERKCLEELIDLAESGILQIELLEKRSIGSAMILSSYEVFFRAVTCIGIEKQDQDLLKRGIEALVCLNEHFHGHYPNIGQEEKKECIYHLAMMSLFSQDPSHFELFILYGDGFSQEQYLEAFQHLFKRFTEGQILVREHKVFVDQFFYLGVTKGVFGKGDKEKIGFWYSFIEELLEIESTNLVPITLIILHIVGLELSEEGVWEKNTLYSQTTFDRIYKMVSVLKIGANIAKGVNPKRKATIKAIIKYVFYASEEVLRLDDDEFRDTLRVMEKWFKDPSMIFNFELVESLKKHPKYFFLRQKGAAFPLLNP